jgi:hypothetical protein
MGGVKEFRTKSALKTLIDLHVLAPLNTNISWSFACLSVCFFVSLASAWTVGYIFIIHNKYLRVSLSGSVSGLHGLASSKTGDEPQNCDFPDNGCNNID